MNSINARRSIKQFIRAYQDELLEDLESNNEPWRIQKCTTSRLTPPSVSGNGLYIGIIAGETQSYFDASQMGTSINYERLSTSLPETARYDVEIHVGGWANIQEGEEEGGDYEYFETDTETFETFIARLVDLFRKYTTIDSETGSYTIRLFGDGGENDRRIHGRDISIPTDESTGESRRALQWVLRLRVETCGETTPLSRS